MRLSEELSYLLTEIQEKENDLSAMSEAWEGDDPEAASCSDPSDQFCLGEEIDRMWIEFKKLVNERIMP